MKYFEHKLSMRVRFSDTSKRKIIIRKIKLTIAVKLKNITFMVILRQEVLFEKRKPKQFQQGVEKMKLLLSYPHL